jgi:hypothetical protein
MKKYFYFPLALILLAGVLATGAKAQTNSPQRLVANIPFAFKVGDRTLPAGHYTISVLNPSSDRKTLQVRSMDGRSTAIVLTNNASGKLSEQSKLVFDRYGDHYFFAQAQMAGDSTTLAAVRSKAERAERLAVSKLNKKSVVVITG